MNHLIEILGVYVFLINLSGFAIIGYDKKMSKVKGWRISEKQIFLVALIGGAIGVYLGMMNFRHKTRHRLMVYGVMLLILLNLVVFYFLVNISIANS